MARIERNEDGLTFKGWMRKVDAILRAAFGGLDSGDLRDRCYWDAWHDGVDPLEFVRDEWGCDPRVDPETAMRFEIFG